MSQTSTDLFRGRVFLAPLTRGGNLPFRRLALELGAGVTVSEMAMAPKIVREARGERALMRRAPEETTFGIQLAGRRESDLAQAAVIAQEHGASFVDLNLGCPIDLLCRKGMGAALLRKPTRVGRLVRAMVDAVDIPVSVKIRLGWDDQKPRFLEVGRAAEEAGAAAVTLHGRSRTQRYRRAASWEAIGQLAAELSIPVIGNGDLLTWREVHDRWAESGCASVMLGRGALIKPWLFREIQERRDFLLTPEQRIALYRRYLDLALEHFGDDEKGRTRARQFLKWHLGFFNRYRPVPSDRFVEGDHPLIQTRSDEVPEVEGWMSLVYRTDEEGLEQLTERLMGDLDPPTGLPPLSSGKGRATVTPPAWAILDAA